MTDIRPIWERSHPVAIAEVERLRAALTEIANTPARADVTGETMFTHVRLLAHKALDYTLEQKGNENDRRSHQG